jgi:hypothetical protein
VVLLYLKVFSPAKSEKNRDNRLKYTRNRTNIKNQEHENQKNNKEKEEPKPTEVFHSTLLYRLSHNEKEQKITEKV